MTTHHLLQPALEQLLGSSACALPKHAEYQEHFSIALPPRIRLFALEDCIRGHYAHLGFEYLGDTSSNSRSLTMNLYRPLDSMKADVIMDRIVRTLTVAVKLYSDEQHREQLESA